MRNLPHPFGGAFLFQTKTHTMKNTHSTKGRDLAWDIFVGLRSNQFKDMSLEEIDDFRTVAASFLNLKKED